MRGEGFLQINQKQYEEILMKDTTPIVVISYPFTVRADQFAKGEWWGSSS